MNVNGTMISLAHTKNEKGRKVTIIVSAVIYEVNVPFQKMIKSIEMTYFFNTKVQHVTQLQLQLIR